MRPRSEGKFVAGFDPKVLLPDGTRVKIAGPCGSFRDGEAVTFWVATEYGSSTVRMVAHSLEVVSAVSLSAL